jgi:rRNA maturation endonuclease Nob1
MGLFEKLGRGVESFKQQAEDASEETASRQCIDCGEAVYAERTECPECGGETVAVTDETDESQ